MTRKYKNISKCYFRLIKAGKKKFKQVPRAFRKEVKELLELEGLGHLAEI